MVNNINPILYNLTRPNISDNLPKVKRTEAVTIQYPRAIHTRVSIDVCRLIAIVGNAITTIFRSTDAIKVPIVVLLSAVHLYSNHYILI